MPIAIIVLPGVLYTVYIMVKYICPFFNRFFAKVWSEEDTEKNATMARIREMYVDGDVPEEVALMMASAEAGQSKESILNAFGAMDAYDLANIIRNNPRGVMTVANQLLENGYKKGMK